MSDLQAYIQTWLAGETEPGVTHLIGIRLLDCGEGTARLELQTGQQHHNPMGIVHGGILCDLADAAMGTAMASALCAGETFTTLELHMNYFRPVRTSLLTALGEVIRRGSGIAYVECKIVDEEEHLVAKASSTCYLQPVTSKVAPSP